MAHIVMATANARVTGVPTYQLVKGDILSWTVDAIVVNTGYDMKDDYMEFPRRSGPWLMAGRRRWYKQTYPRDQMGNRTGVSVTREYNRVTYEQSVNGGLMTDTAFETPSGQNGFHNLVLMANVREVADGRNANTLRQMYIAILDRVMALPLGGRNNSNINQVMPWRWAPVTIAFPLLGFRGGYSYNICAEQALAAMDTWFNRPTRGAARRGQVTRVDLMCPTHHKEKGDRMDQLIEHAWRRTWDAYIRAPGAPKVSGRDKPPREAERLRKEANIFIGNYDEGQGTVDPRLGSLEDDYEIAVAGATAEVQTRIDNRVLRTIGGRARLIPI